MTLEQPNQRLKFSVTQKDPRIVDLMVQTDHRILARWAIDCVDRVLNFFEDEYPQDPRPRNAVESLQAWIDMGVFHMADIRQASLDSHAAARDIGEDNPARSAARAAGQAVATAHVAAHSIAAANYALQAIFRAAEPHDANALVTEERDWQYQKLVELNASQKA